ncbi:hypothetical protein NP233_g8914 [Leucocoprinus birnbaumii]|uniref:Uncharacterized protein n=1 Tax=Leucocoprinus birnbaumii TaxID=56174 RepID=A0AAD5YNM1_9AGAR|nr:hypothetical protein NP233_g8914 [Leucocoprinus birnbaumii]
MSSPSPEPDLSSRRKQKLALRLTDSNNAAEPVLKQQQLAVQQLKKTQVRVEDIDNNEHITTSSPHGGAPRSPNHILEANDGSDNHNTPFSPSPSPPAPKPMATTKPKPTPELLSI